MATIVDNDPLVPLLHDIPALRSDSYQQLTRQVKVLARQRGVARMEFRDFRAYPCLDGARPRYYLLSACTEASGGDEETLLVQLVASLAASIVVMTASLDVHIVFNLTLVAERDRLQVRFGLLHDCMQRTLERDATSTSWLATMQRKYNAAKAHPKNLHIFHEPLRCDSDTHWSSDILCMYIIPTPECDADWTVEMEKITQSLVAPRDVRLNVRSDEGVYITNITIEHREIEGREDEGNTVIFIHGVVVVDGSPLQLRLHTLFRQSCAAQGLIVV